MFRRGLLTLGAVSMWCLGLLPLQVSSARGATSVPAPAGAALDSTDAAIEAAESDTPLPPYDQKLMTWSDYKGEKYTFHFGYNVMYDVVGYNQDHGSVTQWGDLKNPDSKFRDVRLLA